MGNACCTATNAPEGPTTSGDILPPQKDFEAYTTPMEGSGHDSHIRDDHNITNVKAAPAVVDSAIKEPEVKLEVIVEQVNDQKEENDENKVEIDEYEFKRQLDSLKKAMNNASSLERLSYDGFVVTQAIGSLEIVIQILSLSHISTQYSREIKQDLLGLYGDLQMFRSFHLRYTLDQSYYKNITAIKDLSEFIQQAYLSQTKDGKTNTEALLKDIQQGPSHDAFEAIRKNVALVRSAFNRIAGQNFSTLPNYLYVTFNNEPGFALWNAMFPYDFETSNTRFADVYAGLCQIDSQKILKIIALLDNANDQRVDIYQWIDFVKTNSAYLDSEGYIIPQYLDQFSQQIERRAASMKAAPVSQTNNVYKFKSGITFTGTLDQDYKRQGHGILVDEEYVFEGEFLNDLANGQGKETRKKVVYEGTFKNGLYDGYGTLTFPNTRSYKGEFSKHQFHGQGELTGDDGIKYEGTWKNGELSQGKITYHDGSFYVGQIYQNFFRHGKGVLNAARLPIGSFGIGMIGKIQTYIDGTWEKDTPVNGRVFNFLETLIYDGKLDNWSITGRGKRTYVDGVYEGELLRDKRNNEGTLTYLNGDKFIGKWLEDQQQTGKFLYGKEKDHTYEGEWKNGQMEGKGKFTYSSGGIYEGEVKEGKRAGKGTYKFTNGNRYEGQWADNNQEGEGKFYYQEGGDVYSGQFSKGKFHGFGQYYYKTSGKQYIGEWDNDQWSGSGKFVDADNKVIKCGIWKNDKLEQTKDEKEIVFPESFKHLLITIEKPAIVAAVPAQQAAGK